MSQILTILTKRGALPATELRDRMLGHVPMEELYEQLVAFEALGLVKVVAENGGHGKHRWRACNPTLIAEAA